MLLPRKEQQHTTTTGGAMSILIYQRPGTGLVY